MGFSRASALLTIVCVRRHVILPKEIAKQLPKPMRLLAENEWRRIGVQQSKGWVHYAVHMPEPHVLLFRRALGTDPRTGKPSA
jgi:cyclin-dependent kinase regulatory subunit CKS1